MFPVKMSTSGFSVKLRLLAGYLSMANRKLRYFDNISLESEAITDKLDFTEIFMKPGPVHVEIGSGRGTFLVGQAPAFPKINFLGIEWASRYYRIAVDRIGRWGFDNVRMTRDDAASFVTEKINDGSVDWFHIYFPDPWPKTRHHKRRFFNVANVLQLLRCLKTDGVIQFASDHEDYFRQVREVIADEKIAGKIEEIEFVRAAGSRDKEVVGTNFERKYVKVGRPIYTVAVRKL
jgi:tRNA (guanine-N7-)-methyltransferase